jgi:hypothetical protein
MSAGNSSAGNSAFVPLLLLVVTSVTWTTFQCLQLTRERGRLQAAITGQDAQMEQSAKVRSALESLATRTARLARGGNANATIIVEELRKRGITIDPDSATTEVKPPAP